MHVRTYYDGCSYITAGKLYRARQETSGAYTIKCDDESEIQVCLKGSSHLDGHDWELLDKFEAEKVINIPTHRQFIEGADMVNHPPHYTQGDIECIDAIKAALTPDEFRGYCKGAAQKYIWRERHKGGDESLEKAVWYLNKAVEAGDE